MSWTAGNLRLLRQGHSSAPGVKRGYATFSAYAAEVLDARVYDCVHYRTSGKVGAAMGRQIGAYVVANALKPVR